MHDAISTSLAILVIVGPLGCILPDVGIEVYATQECGYQFSASTGWAWGVSGVGDMNYITTDEEPIVKKWCLSPNEAEFMQFPQSWMKLQILADVIATCEARALEMQLGQNNCSDMATVTYSGPCPGVEAWCEDEDANDEVGIPDLPAR